MAESASFGTVCAVVVTYNIGNAFEAGFNSLKGQVDHVILVNTSTDAGETAKVNARLRDAQPDFVTLIESPENNLALAQNLGIDAALEKGHDWVLILDHDSRLCSGMIAAMETAYFQNMTRSKIGLLAPALEDPSDPNRFMLKARQKFWFKKEQFSARTPVIDNLLCVIASGSLIPRRVFTPETRMDEGLVIDAVDSDFCLNIVKRGWRIMAVRDAKMTHSIGERKTHHLFGITVQTTNHSPIRRYYQFRNRLLVWRRYFFAHPGYVIYDLMHMVYELWRIQLFEQDRQVKTSHILRGLVDGFLGKRGPMRGTSLARKP